MKVSNQNSHEGSVSRRGFLAGLGLSAGAAAVPAAVKAEEAGAAKVMPAYRKLGRTGLEVSTLSMGSVGGQEVNLFKFAIERGINFIHTCVNYSGGKSIVNVGKAIEGRRDKLFLGLKCAFSVKDDAGMDDSLKKLGVDHVDIAFFHIHDSAKVNSPEYAEAAARWKKAGKCRFIGITSHKDVAGCLEAALQQGFYDVLMPAYNLTMEKEFEAVFQRAVKDDVGIVLMKTQRGLDGQDYGKAVARYLETPGVTTVVKGMSTYEQIDELIGRSTQKLTAADRRRLEEISRMAMAGRCAMCGKCTGVCPGGVAVSDIVRCSDYYLSNSSHFGAAVETYRALEVRADLSVCESCRICEAQCPGGVPIVHHLRRAELVLA